MTPYLRRRFFSVLHLALCLGAPVGVGSVIRAEPSLVTVRPTGTDALLANPGMGWETFGRPANEDKNLPADLPSTMLYARWGWRVLEPRPGQLATDLVDRFLREAHAAGQKLAFRVMCCSPYPGQPYHPAWLKEVGGRVLILDHKGLENLPVPDLDDPIVLARHLDFIRRLGARYDGNPDLDHLDLGSVGWWGEWHMSGSKLGKMPTLENRMKVVNAYLAAFKKTPLLIPLNGEACTTYATAHGTGWRADSLGDLGAFSATWNHMRNGYPLWIKATQVQEVWKTAPVGFEPPNGVDEFVRRGWPLRWIFNYALACHATYFNGKSGRLPDDANFHEELTRFLRRLGYRLVLKEITFPARAQAGNRLSLALQWQNVGSAPCYQPYRIAYCLTNGQGEETVIVGKFAVNHWLPGSIALFTPEFFREAKDLPPGPTAEMEDSIRLPQAMPAGAYTLSVGVVGLNDETPIVRLGIAGRTEAGWYPVGKLSVVE